MDSSLEGGTRRRSHNRDVSTQAGGPKPTVRDDIRVRWTGPNVRSVHCLSQHGQLCAACPVGFGGGRHARRPGQWRRLCGPAGGLFSGRRRTGGSSCRHVIDRDKSTGSPPVPGPEGERWASPGGRYVEPGYHHSGPRRASAGRTGGLGMEVGAVGSGFQRCSWSGQVAWKDLPLGPAGLGTGTLRVLHCWMYNVLTRHVQYGGGTSRF